MLEELRRRLAALDTERAAAVEAMEAAATPAGSEERSLTPEEDAAFTEARQAVLDIDERAVTLEAEIADLEKIEARTAATANRAPFNVNPGRSKESPYGEVRADTPHTEIRGRVEAAIETERGLTQDEQGHVMELVETLDRGEDHGDRLARHIIATGRPEYRSAFGKIMSNHSELLTPEESRAVTEARAASLTGNAGGFAVPYVIDTTIIDTNAGSVNPMRQIATVKSITTNVWQGVSSAGVTASWDGEAGEVSDDAPTLADPSITAHKAQAFVPYSIEAGEDWVGMEADVRAMFARAKDNLEAAAHFTGSGSSQPIGIVTALDGGSSEVAPDTAEVFSEIDLYALETALPARYRTNAAFTANKAIYQLVRQFANSDGPDLWVRLGAGQPAELIGYPAHEASAMDSGFNPAASADNFIIILGDFSNYYIVDRVGMSVELVPHLFATGNNRPSGQRGLYAYWRTGADSVNDDGFRMLNVATTA